MPTRKRYRCRYCGVLLDGWLPWAQAPNGSLLLAHLGQAHPDRVGAYLDRIEDMNQVGPIAAEAYELINVEDLPVDSRGGRGRQGAEAQS